MAKRRSKKRDHIPALSEDGLKLAIQQLEALNISKAAKQQLIAMLQAASNPASESVDVVINTLDIERRKDVQGTASALQQRMAGVATRGRQALEAMSEDEFNRLVEEANGN